MWALVEQSYHLTGADQNDNEDNENISEVEQQTAGNVVTVTKRQSKLPKPAALSQDEPGTKKSGIPRRTHHSNLPYTPDMDILEQSIHLKIKTPENDDDIDDIDDDNSDKKTIVNWYEDGAFDDIEEPNYSFELMMTAEGEDPIFCIDGDYYDSSGRLLTVQQGKPEVIFVTSQMDARNKRRV